MGKPEYEHLSRDQLEALCGDLTIHVEHYKKEYHKEKQNRISLDRTLTLPNGTVVRAGEFYVIASDKNEARQVDCLGPEILCYFVWEFLKGRWYRTDCETMGTAMLQGIPDWRPWSSVYPDRPVPGSE